jgi:hypothetical protein
MDGVELKFYGLNETIRYLKNYESDLYKTLRKDLVDKSTPLAKLVGSRFPVKPLSNWHSTGDRMGKARMPPYMIGKAQAGVKAIAGTGVSRSGSTAILRIQQNDAGGQVFDSAGKGSKESAESTFIDNLDSKSDKKSRRGKPRSRIMFGTVKGNQGMIEQDILAIIKTVDSYTTQAINAGTGK